MVRRGVRARFGRKSVSKTVDEIVKEINRRIDVLEERGDRYDKLYSATELDELLEFIYSD